MSVTINDPQVGYAGHTAYATHRDETLRLLDEAYDLEWGEPTHALRIAHTHAILALAAAVAENGGTP